MTSMNVGISTAVPEDAPLMIAWRKFQATPEYANLLSWMGEPKYPQKNNGVLWGAFMAGFDAVGKTAPEHQAQMNVPHIIAAIERCETALRHAHGQLCCYRTEKSVITNDTIAEIESVLGLK